jgi:hypothetical protein
VKFEEGVRKIKSTSSSLKLSENLESPMAICMHDAMRVYRQRAPENDTTLELEKGRRHENKEH